MWIVIIVWVILGIVLHAPMDWQVIMQDEQCIQSYIWDTLLMRQQLISTHEQTVICGVLRSRAKTYKSLIQRKIAFDSTGVCDSWPKLKEGGDKNVKEYRNQDINETSDAEIENLNLKGTLLDEVWYDKVSTLVSNLIGSLPAIIIFWVGILIWVICGVIPEDAGNSPPYTGETTGTNPRLQKFSALWQLYINTATAVVLLVCTVFLQNIRADTINFPLSSLSISLRQTKELKEH